MAGRLMHNCFFWQRKESGMDRKILLALVLSLWSVLAAAQDTIYKSQDKEEPRIRTDLHPAHRN